MSPESEDTGNEKAALVTLKEESVTSVVHLVIRKWTILKRRKKRKTTRSPMESVFNVERKAITNALLSHLTKSI